MTPNLHLESLGFAGFGVSLLFVHFLRIRSLHNPRHALKDSGDDLVIHRSASHAFAWFLILVAVMLLQAGTDDVGATVGKAWTSATFALVGVVLIVSWGRMLRRFTLTDTELSDVGTRRRIRIPLIDILSVEVRLRLGFLPVLRIALRDGTVRELWAFDFTVTAESVAAALNARLPAGRRLAR